MFNPTTKLDLFRYWKFLESAGYEPVGEYCTALEAYEIRSNPDAPDLSKIILQLSRFFKEYSDFETSLTPQFLHPSVLNKHTFKVFLSDHNLKTSTRLI